ncbi:MAG: indolepyruvate oxidoreductase subunit beta [Oscillospiraceae bacterium]|nr:indolepyruvate oxidoreductase subunit beta [Oscillospiraceae bacterium]
MEYNIVIAGTGGQGTVLASKLLAGAAMKKGLFARTSETIGMAQRGGSVTSHVRFSENPAAISSPILGLKTADMLIVMELAETVRVLPLIKEGGAIFTCNNAVFPITGSYDASEVLEYLQKAAPDAFIADCINFMQKNKTTGTKTLNVFMLGIAAASGELPFSADELEESIRKIISPRFLEINLTAFNAGKKLKEGSI